MATEIITSYPIPPWRQPMDSYTDLTLSSLELKLNLMAGQLSRIEELVSKLQPRE